MGEALSIDVDHSVAVYLGPSLSLERAKEVLTANYYPPVKLGDLYKLMSSPVQTIVILDGLFDGTTPVWQREILALLEAGKKVFGASSMGALRAAELSPYGMQGFGVIYEWYRDGVIDGDDEVGLLHGAEQIGYLKISEPLVNIRFNLQVACEEKIISKSQHDDLVLFAKSRYFGDRKLPLLVEYLQQQGDQQTSVALAGFFEQNYVDIKERDALELLSSLADADSGESNGQPLQVGTGDSWYQRRPYFGSQMHEIEIFHGGIYLADGNPEANLVSHRTLTHNLRERWDDYETLLMQQVEYCFLLAVCAVNDRVCTATDAQLQDWCRSALIDNLSRWLAQNGMTHAEWQCRAAAEISIQSALQILASEWQEEARALEYWIFEANATSPRDCLDSTDQQLAVKILSLNQWATESGYRCPPDWRSKVTQWQRENSNGIKPQVKTEAHIIDAVAMYSWMMTNGPLHYGFDFTALMSVFKALQMQGRIEELL